MKTPTQKRILVIEDDQDIQDVIKHALMDHQYEVLSLSETKNILNEIKIFEPQVVLLDYILPEINGGELCHQIKNNAETSGIAVILYSAHPRILKSLGYYGCDAFLEKPFDLWELVSTIDHYAEKVQKAVDV